jgi:hypothetical protein
MAAFARKGTSWLAVLTSVTLISSVPAFAQTVTDTFGPFSVDSPGVGQLSSNVFNRNVTTAAGPIEAEYTASPAHCSNVIMHFLLDGVEQAVSGVLTPGASTGFVSLGSVSAGPHVVGLQAEGVVSGCNVGDLQNWGGTGSVRFQAQTVPTLTEWAQIAMLGALIAAGLFVLRRRRLA